MRLITMILIHHADGRVTRIVRVRRKGQDMAYKVSIYSWRKLYPYSSGPITKLPLDTGGRVRMKQFMV